VDTIESVYAVLLVIALVLNGIALAGATPLRNFFAPLREWRLILAILALDVVLVPVVAVGLASLLGLDEVTRAALVIIAAASAGPIGIALTRASRGDVPLAVTTVLGLGVLNLVTVPIVTGVLLPESLPLPPSTIVSSLIGLAVAPLLAGRVFALLMGRTGVTTERIAAWLATIGRVADVSLAAAVTVAVLLEPREAIAVLLGPVSIIAFVVMLTIAVSARLITPDSGRRRAIIITINARAVGLALTLTALHLGDVPGLRTTVLAFGGLTQAAPILLMLATRWWRQRARISQSTPPTSPTR